MKKLKYLLPIFIISLTLTFGKAQIIEKYESQTIYLQSGAYVKDGKRYPIGYFSRKLKQEMAVSPEAMNVYQKFQKQRSRDLVFIGIFIATEVTAAFVDDKGLKNGLIFGGLAIPIVTIPFTKNAGNTFQKAIWIRNRDVLK